jgi:hydrogenase maturation protease
MASSENPAWSFAPRPSSTPPHTVIIGLGNPILGDDGVGWHVARQVALRLPDEAGLPIEVDYLSLGGLSLMERLIGYRQAIIIDAITTHQQPCGSVMCCSLDDLPHSTASHLASAHDTALQTAIAVGRSMDAQLPEQITIVTVEAAQVFDFSEELTPAVAAAIPQATQAVLDILLPDPDTPHLANTNYNPKEACYDLP